MFSLLMKSMPIGFYFLKIRGDADETLSRLKGLGGVEYAALVLGKYDAIVKVSGTYPKDVVGFWFEAVKIPGVEIENKALTLNFGESW